MPAAPTLLTGRVLTPGGMVERGAVVLRGDRIAYAGRLADLPAHLSTAAAPADWAGGLTLLPGLVDLHCHGGAGGEFGPDADGGRAAAAHHRRHGTTSLVGSLVSASPGQLVAGVATTARLVAEGLLAGVHLEGPFLSVARRGAQDAAALTDVHAELVTDLVEAADVAGAPQAIVQMTFAPERPGAGDLPGRLGAYGILPAVGHTDADDDTTRTTLRTALASAPRGGRPLVTHVFNGMRPLLHRDPGPVAAALEQAARGEAVLEVVGDGVHLAAGTVRLLFAAAGADSLALVTDAMAASGMPEGTYALGGQEVVVEGRTARLAQGGAIAGGVATLLDVVRWCVQEAGIPLADAVTAASATPAAAAGFVDVGRLATHTRADVLAVDDDLRPRAVWVNGVRVNGVGAVGVSGGVARR